ncbi:EAL domain-containing protein [Acidithiobacillus ferriphilus]|uniref:EAL domain-containing protein n=1 Tax=Acidithiobacillus ferriphilus TaxID=1689834 RepID=UPI00232F9731|nr:EAL domain-containing protein [Acidithiobacillus ferriphilus]WCE93162.1 EAL domain-containing protein [Acidithiobacillus ferriphilus]
MEYRKLWAVGVAFALLTGLAITLVIHQSHKLYQTLSENIHLSAEIAAQNMARQVSAGLDRPFNDLYYISNALLPAGAQLSSTTLEQIQIIRVLDPGVIAIQILNAPGDHVLWTTSMGSARPMEPQADFTPLPGHSHRMIGQPRYDHRAHAWVVPLIYMEHKMSESSALSISSLVDLVSLKPLAISPDFVLRVLGAHDVPIALFRQGLHPAKGRFTALTPSQGATLPARVTAAENQVRVTVPGYPWTVEADWSSALVEQLWWHKERDHLPLAIGIILGILVFGVGIIRMLIREMHLHDQQHLLTTQITHDFLTNLPNREGLRRIFDQALARSDRQERLLAVGFLDIDDFKPVNDTYGHAAGDVLLQEMASRLQSALRQTDTVARLGGDEFVLLLEGLRSMDELDQVLARLQASIAQPFNVNGEVINIHASLGLSIYPFDDGDADILLRHADQAMYGAKTRPAGCGPDRTSEGWVQLYHQDLGTITIGDEVLRQDFLRALGTGEVTLRYQPLVALATGRVAGLEALTRWHREGREASPDQFLPSLGVREHQALGHFVLQTGLQQLAQWRDMGLDLFLSINVTPEELDQSGFADTVLSTLADYPGIPPDVLILEVLEIGEILEQEVAMGHLQRLRGAGVKIALDDVGSAYASLLRLKNLPIDEIKIDQGFIRELLNKPQDLIFVESLINLGLGMDVIIAVEGVESEAHIALLREMEVDYLQGYAIARPLEVGAVADFVHIFVLGAGDADTPLLALYQHLGWVHAAEEIAMNHGGYEHDDLAACPITTWLHAHMSELPEVEALLAEHEAVHALGREILRVRSGGNREELHRLLGQLHVHSHRFQEGLGQAVKTMRENAADKG